MDKNEELSKYEYDSIKKAIDELKKGRIIIVSDNPDRENEGDMICAGEFATPENINIMASVAKGLICTPMSKAVAKKLGLNLMVGNNTDNHNTAFTISVDHVECTTGISAFERSLSIKKCCDTTTKPEDLRRPGHIFPLVAKEGGVLERNGHTEATVELMRLAGLYECGVCCEIMEDDGTMMKTKNLWKLAKEHNFAYITIKQLQEYVKTNVNHAILEAKAFLPTKYGDFKIYGFVNDITKEHHIALVKGEVGDGKDFLVRIHSECLTGDAFASSKCDCGDQLDMAMKLIEKEGRGAIIYMRQEGRGIGLINKLKAYSLQEKGFDTVDANVELGFAPDLREYWFATQMLKNLGVKSINLISNNPDKLESIEKYGIKIEKRVPIEIEPQKHDLEYLKTKETKMGHIFEKINLK